MIEAAGAEHLIPAARPLLALSAAERIARIRTDRWVDYPRAALALRKLADLLGHPQRARMPNLLIWGDSGMGKTMIAEKHLRDHPPSFDQVAGVRRTPVLAIEMPATPDPKWLFAQILKALDAPLPAGSRVDLATLAPRTIKLMQMIGVRMLVIDEVHNLLVGPHRTQRAMLNLIRQLANELRIPIVCLGTREGREALLSDPQLARRFEGFELPRWQRGEEFHGLLNTLLHTLPLRKPSRLGIKAFDQMLARADGITSNIFTLLTELAVAAIRGGQEEITAADIRRSDVLASPLGAAV
ncbi:MAG TPA: TniB family NTP-binding protein [Acetobacteraceae bacterium]|nr:TniB family NTP-binding protein [Acetobacteraceae bacterium]